MNLTRHYIQATIVLIFGLAGCQGGSILGEGPSIDTVLDKTEVLAGTAIAVTCPVTGDFDRALDTQTTVAVVPTDNSVVDDHTVTATVVGTYTVTCSAPDLGLVDDTPVQFEVIANDPAKVTTILSDNPIAAGDISTVTCEVEDAYGNPLPDAATSVVASQGLTVNDHTVSSTVVGEYSVTCAVDKFEDVEANTEILTVTPDDPVRVVLTITPDKPVYAVSAEVTASWQVFDQFDNLVTDAPALLTFEPDEGLSKTGETKRKFVSEGTYLVTVTLDAPFSNVSDSKILHCDESAPILEIFFPPRGHTQDGDGQVVLSGQVIDGAGSDIDFVRVNGKPAEVDADGYFEMSWDSVHGLNSLIFTAGDVFGHETYTTRGYYYSNVWQSVDDESTMEELTTPDAAMLYFGQSALDDNVHDHSHLDDLATILEVLLSLDIDDLLGGIPPFDIPLNNIIDVELLGIGLQGDLEIIATITEVSLGTPNVVIDSRDGGIYASIAFDDVVLGLELTFIVRARATAFGSTYDLLNPSTTTTSHLRVGRLGIGVSLDIDKPVDGDLYVQGRDFQLELTDVGIDLIETLYIDLGQVFGIDLGEWDLSKLAGNINNLLSDYVLNPLINFITQPLIDLLEPLVVDIIGDTVKQLFELLNINQTITIPDLLGIGKSPELDLALSPSTVLFREDGGTIGLNLGLHTDKAIDKSPLGAILRGDCEGNSEAPGDFAFETTPEIQLAFNLDMINQALFMVWWSGFFTGTFDLSAMLAGQGLPVENLIITPDLYHPPILNDCGDGLSLEIGDLYLDIAVDLLGSTQWIEAWLQLGIEAEIVGQGNEVGIRIGKITAFETEIKIYSDLDMLVGMLEDMIPDLIKGIEGQEFTFPIPAIELGGMLPGLPADATLQLGNFDSKVTNGVVTIGGDLL